MTEAVRSVDNGNSAGPPPRAPLRVTRAGVIGSVLLAVVMLMCVRLGFWQLARLEERRLLNTLVAERIDTPALTDATALADTAGLFYRTATLHGSFDHERSIVLPGRSLRGVPGVHLLTPLRLDGRGDAIIVNRGWVPSADAATIEVADFATVDTATVHGLLLPFPGAAESLAQRDPRRATEPAFRRVWYTVDESALRAQHPYPLLPAAMQELPVDGVQRAGRSSYPTRLEPPPLDEGPHLGYALQWFSFALIGLIGWLALMLKGRTPPRIIVPPAAD